MIASARQIGILMIAVAFLSLGHGLNGSLIGVRASAENFSTAMTGLIMSGYFAGLLAVGLADAADRATVGHIRVFAGFASVVSSVVLLFPLVGRASMVAALRFIAGLLHVRPLYRMRELAEFGLEQPESRQDAVDLHGRQLWRDGRRAAAPQRLRRIGLCALHHRLGAAVVVARALVAGANRDAKPSGHAQGHAQRNLPRLAARRSSRPLPTAWRKAPFSAWAPFSDSCKGWRCPMCR